MYICQFKVFICSFVYDLQSMHKLESVKFVAHLLSVLDSTESRQTVLVTMTQNSALCLLGKHPCAVADNTIFSYVSNFSANLIYLGSLHVQVSV